LATAAVAVAPIHEVKEASAPDRYIVVFHPNTTAGDREVHISKVVGAIRANDGEITANFTLRRFSAYAARLSPRLLRMVQQAPEVNYIEREGIYHANQEVCHKQSPAIWNLQRVNERTPSFINANYHYDNYTGVGVVAYVVDTGVYVAHNEFEGRAVWGKTFIGTDTDCNGHGTHVAGTIGGKTYGVAKKVTLVAVKVLDCGGSGTTAGVVAGVVWAAADRQARAKDGVANLSLGGGKSQAMRDAVQAAVEDGLTMIVAAGNSDMDACNTSPADSPFAITIGATVQGDGNQDERSYYSNYGTCVTLFAPGTAITSAWIGGPTFTNTISGTSMATPHVAGAACQLLSHQPGLTPAELEQEILQTATTGTIDLVCGPNEVVCTKSPNIMVYTNCGDARKHRQ